jgi:3-hydroxyisobutyrate dehydrogenase-like beta-hydroxyacid dehydrogenase
VSGFDVVCILGFGEVGQTLADDLTERTGAELPTFDVLFADDESVPTRAAEGRPGVVACATPSEAAANADLVISAVTASQATAAATSVAGSLAPGCFYMDLNSVSPQSRRDAAAVIGASGGRFVEAALMAPIGARRLESPFLLGGPHAEAFSGPAHALGFSGASVFAREIGRASAVKMCRSVIIKGMEALLAESLAAARHHGVVEEVLDSLGNLLPMDDWEEKARYMISRSLEHGERRAEEMREVATTVAEAGIAPLMSEAAVDRQQWAARFVSAVGGDLDHLLDALLERNETQRGAADG